MNEKEYFLEKEDEEEVAFGTFFDDTGGRGL